MYKLSLTKLMASQNLPHSPVANQIAFDPWIQTDDGPWLSGTGFQIGKLRYHHFYYLTELFVCGDGWKYRYFWWSNIEASIRLLQWGLPWYLHVLSQQIHTWIMSENCSLWKFLSLHQNFWLLNLLPIWWPSSEGSIIEKLETIRSGNSTSAFIRETKTSRFHGSAQRYGSWLLSRMVVYLPNILGRAMSVLFGTQIDLQPLIYVPLLPGSILPERNWIKNKTQLSLHLCLLAFLFLWNLVLVSDSICATITYSCGHLIHVNSVDHRHFTDVFERLKFVHVYKIIFQKRQPYSQEFIKW